MRISLKNRIAGYFLVTAALIVAGSFTVVNFIVSQTVYKNLDDDLSFEAKKHIDEIQLVNDDILFSSSAEWNEIEHREIQVNPVFLQLINKTGKVLDKSPNLQNSRLIFNENEITGGHFNADINNRVVRQVQIPVVRNGVVKGYIVAAMSLEHSLLVLENLRTTLFLLYPVILIALFFISSLLAGRSIIPVKGITKAANRITKNNLNERIELPANKDELYDLTDSINSLLIRIEDALEREKQFTADASHELRTPLSVLRGTLEVLLRKERSPQEYQTQIAYSLNEIDRMADIIDQLFTLVRLNPSAELELGSLVPVVEVVNQVLEHQAPLINDKNVIISIEESSAGKEYLVTQLYTSLILENIIGNAVKYSHSEGKINIELQSKDDGLIVKVKDEGIGMKKEDLQLVFRPFFRSDALEHKNIKGVGLGLSIAKKAADFIQASLDIESVQGSGTTVIIKFKQILRSV